MTLQERQSELEERVKTTAAALKAIKGVGIGESGLTPDAVKFSPEYQEAARRYRVAFDALREFNKQHATTLHKARRSLSAN